MVSWAITGATRGIGLGFVDNLSADPANTVFALIRSRATAGALEQLAATRKTIHIIVTDLADPKSLAQAAADISAVTGGSLDVLILNAGSAAGPPEASVLAPAAFHGKEDALEKEINENIKANLLSNMYVIHAVLDLIRHGAEKKLVFISSPSGDLEFTRRTGLAALVGYSVAKAGMNVVTTKFGAELAREGIRTLSMSPGWVDTDAGQ
ncbi:hypothetical protein CLAIMM_14182 [Cladophialophora immunda]|nr:hypothetical protein CLAIMM_14182 [Cladophialophora immunda]